MALISLVVKGTFADAERAATKRGITLLPVFWDLQREVTVFARPPVSEGAVEAWFCESGEPPYEPGTLLYYSMP